MAEPKMPMMPKPDTTVPNKMPAPDSMPVCPMPLTGPAGPKKPLKY